MSGDASAAFRHADGYGSYRPIPTLRDVPSVCLRLPTGGGKTILAAYSVGVAARHYRDTDTPVVLWLVPSSAIAAQTLKALQNHDHPYRQVLNNRFNGRVRVYSIADFATITAQDVAVNCSVVVATMQALRQTGTERLQVYADNEDLEGHFKTALARATPGLQLIDEGKPGAGEPRASFMNVLKMHRPIVLVDEAQNFATTLSEEIHQRLGPSVVIEFTATPHAGSNVLYRASAAELKADDMIKLPVVLDEHLGDWRDAVCRAVSRRRKIAEIAASENAVPGENPVRPLLLIQAENQGRAADWQAVKQYLMETEHLREEEVAVQTQNKRDLDGVDLFAASCPITTIITVQALREGWDCSFAYVLCSTANVGNETAVEQWLGRVLRMPYARRRSDDALNKAYAHVVSATFGQTARQLKDALVHLGFEPGEAEASLQGEAGVSLFEDFRRPFVQVLESPPVLNALSEVERANVQVVATDNGFRLTARGPMPAALIDQVERLAPANDRLSISTRAATHNAEWKLAPSEQGELFLVPRLVTEVDGEPQLFDMREIGLPWNLDLTRYPADLSAFRFDEVTRTYMLDYEGHHITISQGQAEQMQFLPVEETLLGLVAWLDRQLRHPQVTQASLSAWIRKALMDAEVRGNSLDVLFRGKFLLRRKLAELFAYAQAKETARGYQTLLGLASVQSDEEFAFTFPHDYPAHTFMPSTHRFLKHFYPRPGELKDRGEEFQCAVEIDRAEEVEFWVRNLAGPGEERAKASFWLQTSRNRFYPDFVAKLKDGRILVVEYKGREDEEDREKEELGKLWAERSGGRAVFLMARIKDEMGRTVREQLLAAINNQLPTFFARK